MSTGDVVISDISDNTATVSWTVPSITEPQEYYLIYGTSQDRLNLTSDRIRGHIDVSLVNETYSISLQNLESGTEYFVAVVALFGSTTLYSETVSFTTNEPGKTLCIMHTCVYNTVFYSAPAGPPRNFTITVDGISLMFSWQPPAGSRTILSYTVSCSVGRDVEFSARFNPVLGITLNELKPSTDYSCKVYASSSGGDGPPTDDILASTESKPMSKFLAVF